jgi:uncharacterized small protein (DUF1192 family)
MAIEDDDRPLKKTVHEIGSDLSLLSVEELEARIGLLQAEIERLTESINAKRATRSAADKFFR